MMGSVRIQGLGKAYKQYPTRWSRLAEWVLPGGPRHKLHWVLRDVSFEVARGEAVAVIGANGAGKSTLLKIVTGTTQATTGTVAMAGRVAALLELGMGFHPDFSGRQNVYMAGQLLGLGQDDVARLMPQIEAFADIGEYIDEPVRIYSSGMQVRLAFSVATARRPDLLIVDEALSVGDAYFQHKSFGRIREFLDQGMTLLLVSHDLGAVRSICNRAVWLDKGRLRAQGDTRVVVDEYTAAVYSRRQDIEGAQEAAGSDAPSSPRLTPFMVDPAHDVPDPRAEFLAGTALRNDIRVFGFDRRANRWGTGDVRIAGARLEHEDGTPAAWVMGGETVRIVVEAIARAAKEAVFLGFIVKDRTGQPLFGDNTYLRYLDHPVSVVEGERLTARFEFRMPVLPRGAYVVAVAVASGTQSEHLVEEWVDEALFFESHNADTVQGLVGIPMRGIAIEVAGGGRGAR
jgi:lipopolysaccharide transport system ATP-binding protein